MNFRGFPPGCGDSVADFWGWDAREARVRCPDDVSGDMLYNTILTFWWWAQQCSKHVEAYNKLIIKQDFVH